MDGDSDFVAGAQESPVFSIDVDRVPKAACYRSFSRGREMLIASVSCPEREAPRRALRLLIRVLAAAA